MTDVFNWCFIGTGKLAHQVAQQLLSSGRHKILSCYTRNYDNCKAFAEKFGSTPFETAGDAITADGVDAVYIVTPHNAHFRYAKLALELGKPVFCEKAFTVTAQETDELIRLAREKNLFLAEAMWTWFSPAANQVKSWVDTNAIGQISRAEFTYHMKSVNYAPRVSDPRRAGGALLDITLYPITYAYRLFGYPTKIESNGTLANGIDLGEEITMTFPNGVTAYISASIADMKGFEKMTIYGQSGKIKALLYHALNKVTLHKGPFRKQVFKGPSPLLNSYLDEFDAVARDIREGRTESRMVSLQATSDVMHILDEIREQIGLSYPDLE